MTDPALYYHFHIFCCTNKRAPGHERGCCADKGSERLRNYMKKRAGELGLKDVRINTAGCLDRCELGPCVVIYPDGVWYSPKNEADIDEILSTHFTKRRARGAANVKARSNARCIGMNFSDTIFAPATAQGRAGIVVIRISGAAAARALDLCKQKKRPKPREAALREIRDPKSGDLIDKALLLWFPAPHSFTGEDVIEFHLHGSRAILNAVAKCLRDLGFRLAEPGEFTRRAFENGKLDLTEAEALADLVNAETEAQRRQAMRQFEGALGKIYEDWRARLTKTLAWLEAAIDFADEDLPKDMEKKQLKEICALIDEISKHLDDHRRGERLREGFEVAILGPPNAGKSSLLNVLAQREAAIVSSIAGTTRDIVEVHLDLGGYPVILADTAGLRETADEIESEGVKRALARAEKADLKLLVFDGAAWPKLDETTRGLVDENALAVVNKADLVKGLGAGGWGKEKFLAPNPQPLTPISAKTGAGIPELLEKLTAMIEMRFADTGSAPLTRERHRAALEECKNHLQRSLTAKAAELRAEDVRLASRALGRITGSVDVEDLLDVIFRDFCIGK